MACQYIIERLRCIQEIKRSGLSQDIVERLRLFKDITQKIELKPELFGKGMFESGQQRERERDRHRERQTDGQTERGRQRERDSLNVGRWYYRARIDTD